MTRLRLERLADGQWIPAGLYLEIKPGVYRWVLVDEDSDRR